MFVFVLCLALLGAIQASPAVQPKVVGGQDAKQGEFPFMVSLRVNSHHICGGSLVSDQWVLTAGRCFYDFRSQDIEVWYGDIAINKGQSLGVMNTVLHPNFTYDWTSYYIRNDLALLMLESPVNISNSVRPIGLPKQDEAVPFDHQATLIGWDLSGNADGPGVLQKVNLTIFDQSICEYYNAQQNYNENENICAGDMGGTKGQCNGDSGNPLFIDGVLWGVASWNIKPCAFVPGVLTKTSLFADWILNIIS